MADNYQVTQTNNDRFEAFTEQIKQALEHLYDFAYLQKHPLARSYSSADGSVKTAGRQFRYALITAIESLKGMPSGHFRAPDARLYNLLHLIYVENLAIQEVALELGISERQAYRDLKRGQEAIAEVLWISFVPSSEPTPEEFSLRSEIAHLHPNFSTVDVGSIFQQAQKAVERLAVQHAVQIAVEMPGEPMTLLSDPSLAHQMIVSVLSYAVQHAQPGILTAQFEVNPDTVTLTLRYQGIEDANPSVDTKSILSELALRLRWTISYQDTPPLYTVTLRLISHRLTILVIDDNEGWVALLERFLEGFDCTVVTLHSRKDIVQQVQDLTPHAIILDVMMPETDGWEILQRLRAQSMTAHIPIIVCSVLNDPQLAYSLGANAFVAKTTNLEKVLEALRALSIM